MSLSDNAQRLLALLYKKYLQNKDGEVLDPEFLGSSEEMYPILMPQCDFLYFDALFEELSQAKLINVMWADDIAYMVTLKQETINELSKCPIPKIDSFKRFIIFVYKRCDKENKLNRTNFPELSESEVPEIMYYLQRADGLNFIRRGLGFYMVMRPEIEKWLENERGSKMSWGKKLIELVDSGKKEFTYYDEIEIDKDCIALVDRKCLDKKTDIIGNIKLTLNEKAYNKYDELINPPPSSGANINIGQMSGGNVAGQNLTDNSTNHINNSVTTDFGDIITDIKNDKSINETEQEKVTSLVQCLEKANDEKSILDLIADYLDSLGGVAKWAATAIRQLIKKRF